MTKHNPRLTPEENAQNLHSATQANPQYRRGRRITLTGIFLACLGLLSGISPLVYGQVVYGQPLQVRFSVVLAGFGLMILGFLIWRIGLRVIHRGESAAINRFYDIPE